MEKGNEFKHVEIIKTPLPKKSKKTISVTVDQISKEINEFLEKYNGKKFRFKKIQNSPSITEYSIIISKGIIQQKTQKNDNLYVIYFLYNVFKIEKINQNDKIIGQWNLIHENIKFQSREGETDINHLFPNLFKSEKDFWEKLFLLQNKDEWQNLRDLFPELVKNPQKYEIVEKIKKDFYDSDDIKDDEPIVKAETEEKQPDKEEKPELFLPIKEEKSQDILQTEEKYKKEIENATTDEEKTNIKFKYKRKGYFF